MVMCILLLSSPTSPQKQSFAHVIVPFIHVFLFLIASNCTFAQHLSPILFYASFKLVDPLELQFYVHQIWLGFNQSCAWTDNLKLKLRRPQSGRLWRTVHRSALNNLPEYCTITYAVNRFWFANLSFDRDRWPFTQSVRGENKHDIDWAEAS